MRDALDDHPLRSSDCPGPGETTSVADVTSGRVELSGSIKWFDPSKGYGFIVPDNGGPDVLLKAACLRHDGFQTAYPGARVTAEVLRRPKGLICFRIVAMDNSAADPPSTPPRTHVTVTPASGLKRAMVKWFNRVRGFGFLTCGEGTPDIFVHVEIAPLRYRRTTAWPDRIGAIWSQPPGNDGGRGADRR